MRLRFCPLSVMVLGASADGSYTPAPRSAGIEAASKRVLQSPAEVRLYRSDHTIRLLYAFSVQRLVGGKWRCVVLRYPPDDEVCGHGS